MAAVAKANGSLEARLAVCVRRMREWAEWEPRQQTGKLGYSPTCELRNGSGRPASSVTSWVMADDREAMEVARALAELKGSAAYSWRTVFGWMVETARTAGPGATAERLRAVQDGEPEIRDQAAALLASQWYLAPKTTTAGWWAKELGVSVGQAQALHDAAVLRVGEALDRENGRWRYWEVAGGVGLAGRVGAKPARSAAPA
jgi:hypothetical protein